MGSISQRQNKYYDHFRAIQKDLVRQFNKAKNLNYTEFVLSLYPRVTFKKFSKMMNINEKQAHDLIVSYNHWKNPSVQNNPVEHTFFRFFETDLRKVNFRINMDDKEIEIRLVQKNKDLIKTLDGHLNRLDDIIGELETN